MNDFSTPIVADVRPRWRSASAATLPVSILDQLTF